MKSLIPLMVLLLALNSTRAQQYIYKDITKLYSYYYRDGKSNKTYDSRSPWTFGGDNSVNVYIAKKPNGAYLLLSMDLGLTQSYLGGNLIVYLANGKAIKCIDRGIRDNINRISLTQYSLAMPEVEELKLSRITSIEFSIMAENFAPETYIADIGVDPVTGAYITEEDVSWLYMNYDEQIKYLQKSFLKAFQSND